MRKKMREKKEQEKTANIFFPIFGKQFYAKDLYRFIVAFIYSLRGNVRSISKSLCCDKNVG